MGLDWFLMKSEIVAAIGLARDAIHIYVAILIQIAAALLTRRPLSSPIPWLLVLLVACGNEALDTYGDGLAEPWEFDGAAHDLWNGMLAPTLLLLVHRYLPWIARERAPTADETATASGVPEPQQTE